MNEIIDLTYMIQESMTAFDAPWHPRVTITQLGSIEEVGRETRQITFGTHTGTHVDAPRHFVKNGLTLESVPLSLLIGSVVILDFSYLPENGVVTRDMLNACKLGERVLVKYNWGKNWKTGTFYRGYPFFSKEAAELLIGCGVKLLAMDTPSPDDSRIKLSGSNLGTENDSPIHKLFLRNGVILVEYLANLDKITDYLGWQIAIMPLNIKGADGAPARVCVFR